MEKSNQKKRILEKRETEGIRNEKKTGPEKKKK